MERSRLDINIALKGFADFLNDGWESAYNTLRANSEVMGVFNLMS